MIIREIDKEEVVAPGIDRNVRPQVISKLI